MTTMMDVPPGLAGVAVAETAVGDVRGEEGFYHYRQYDACELARTSTFEDVWRLLIDGALPAGDAERAAFAAEVGALRALPGSVTPVIDALASLGAPDAQLRSAIAAVGAARRLRPIGDLSPAERRTDALAVAAVVPTAAAALYRRGNGHEPVAPDPSRPVVEDYLRQLLGEVPDPVAVRALEQYLISTIDHGFNASTFTARVVASTAADTGAAVVAALGALSGPRHGGAPSRVLDLLDAVGTADRAAIYVRAEMDAGRRIPGFGHAVYRAHDPRSELLHEVAVSVGGPRVDVAAEIEEIVVAELARRYPDRRLVTNVEFWAAVVLEQSGMPRPLFTSTFAVARVIGWTANILEQATDPKIIRPAAHYIGPEPGVRAR
jgi:citrate synthase